MGRVFDIVGIESDGGLRMADGRARSELRAPIHHPQSAICPPFARHLIVARHLLTGAYNFYVLCFFDWLDARCAGR